jgi:hypothetical protein
MTITIFNGNINVSEIAPVQGQEFFVEVPLNNDKIFTPPAWDEQGCELPGPNRGNKATINLTFEHKTEGKVYETSRDVCVPLSTLGPEERYQFGVTINEPGNVSIIVSVETFGSGRTDQETKSIEVIKSGEGEEPGTPGNGDGNGDNPFFPDPPGGDDEEGGVLAFALQNPGAAAALAGGAAIAISTFTSSLTE